MFLLFIPPYFESLLLIIGFKSRLAENSDHMQIFDAGLANKNSGIHQQLPLTAKVRPILAIFSTPQIKNIV